MHDRTEVLTSTRTALYHLYDEDEVLLYVGITLDPAQRFKDHRAKPWLKCVTTRTIEWFEDRPSAERAEQKAIRSEGPLHNIAHRPKPVPQRLAPRVNPNRKQITLLDVYRARGFKLTREQARRLVFLLKLTEERPANDAAAAEPKRDTAA
ncbi:GIY-YIG nuclease family protein [Streptomyces halstedii]|uniref:GIY-YIG nuclease family protein n=1 Tax=Streptomyces halstedii TaxID=1944 RepID=UPI0037F7010C